MRRRAELKHLEISVRTKAGALRIVQISSDVIELDGERCTLAGIQDVTERKQIEAALAERQRELERQAQLLELAHEAIMVRSPEGVIRFWNAGAESLYGWTRAQVMGQTTHALLNTQFPISFELVQAELVSRGRWDGELGHTTQAGKQIVVESRWALQRNPVDGEVSFLEINRDITARKHAEQAIGRRNAELAALNQMGQSLSRLMQTGELLELVYTVVGQLLDNQNLYVALYDAVNQVISFPLYVVHGKRIQRPARALGSGLTEYVLQHRVPLFLPRDVAGMARELGVEPQGQQAHCYIAVPMLAGDKILGVISLQDYEREAVYDQGHVDILNTIAAQAAIALENARLFAETEQLSRTDALTGIANRRQLFEVGAHEMNRARRFGHPFSVLMFDIDHFKQVNDAYGHAVGDQVLQAIARCCVQQSRESDLVARYGGEEFAVLLLETNLEGARISAERLRAQIARTAVPTERGPLSLTISCGVAVAQVESDGFATLLVRADSALYAAKQGGRNRVEAA